MNIPLVDLKAQHAEISEEVREGFARVMERTAFVLGEEVEQFEREFAGFCGVEHCIGVASGTDAIELMLRAAGIGYGDEVILPANTFIATALAVVRCGATPVLVDCEPDYYQIDPAKVGAKIGDLTAAILPVHLYGQIAPMEELAKVAAERSIPMFEDAAQAQGAKQGGKGIGAFGRAAATSFYPGKNIGAYGDAGAILTGSAEFADKLNRLRNWGGTVKYEHPEIGFNSRLDTLQAVVLRAKLKRLAAWNEERARAAGRYGELLGGDERIQLPKTFPGNEHVWHLYVVRVPNRDEVLKRLHAAGIGAGIHYPKPIHLQGAFAALGHRPGDFPVAERAADEILSLPLYPHITASQQEQVAAELKKALG